MFSITEFIAFTGETSINKLKYATIFKSVVSYVESVYEIVLTERTETLKLYSTSATELELSVTPISIVSSVEYDSDSIDYTYENNVITFTTSLTDIAIPVYVTLTYGYITIPEDLKLAIYTHVQHIYYALDNHTDNVSKVTNTTGNTIVYRNTSVPPISLFTYDFYSKRQLVL